MSSLLFESFNSIKQAIDECEYKRAEALLIKLEGMLCGTFDHELHHKYQAMLPLNVVNKRIPECFDGELSQYNSRKLIPGISIISCCMNRNENLKKALTSWLKLDVDEIIIVDWSSSIPVIETVSEFNDDRIKIIRVDNETKWVLTYGFNVGLRFASYTKVFKIDADIEVSEDFLTINHFDNNQFIRGFWKSALDQGLDSQVYINGSFGCYKKNLLEVGFYNELITTYGWDDSDLYERLASQSGLGTKYLDLNSVLHLEQEEGERIAFQNISSDCFLGVVPSTEFNNCINKFIGRTTDYWNTERLQNYSIERVTKQLWKCSRISNDIHIPYYLTNDANIYASIHYLYLHAPMLLTNCLSVTNTTKLVFNEYSARVNFNVTLTMMGGGQEIHDFKLFTAKYDTYEKFISSCLKQAKNSGKTIYALSITSAYTHHSIGSYGEKIELVAMPKELLAEVAHIRQQNGYEILDFEQCKCIEKDQCSVIYEKCQKKYVYVDAQHGLGNRLRAIGSAAAIAEKSGRELIIVWEPDHHCECRFLDLFDYSGLVIEASFIDNAQQNMDVYNYMEIESGASKDKEIVIHEDKDLYLRAAYTFNSPLSDWESENKFIKQLTPIAEIEEMVKGFDLTNAIAAHVRMEAGAGLDHNTYDSVENWTQEGHDELHFWREKSHYAHFIKRIDQLFAEQPNFKLFLATDLPENYKVFEDYYGDRLSYLKRDVYDRSKEQIKYALADAILLSKSQKLLGSTWSSYSELAMRMSITFSSIEMSGTDF